MQNQAQNVQNMQYQSQDLQQGYSQNVQQGYGKTHKDNLEDNKGVIIIQILTLLKGK